MCGEFVEMRQFSRILLALTVVSGCTGAFAATVDYDRLGKEAASALSNYIRVDTTNPPGNEEAGARYLADILERHGIAAQLLPVEPGRACVYARLKGNGKKKAVVLLNHIDVVPAQAKDWKYPPFEGSVHDGELWGRGALDMKSMGIIELEAMLQLKESAVALDRDIIFLGTPDEEMGGKFGAGWFKRNHPELVKDAEFLLNEGMGVAADEHMKPVYWGVDVAEKSVLWVRLTAKGSAGHGSMPIANSAPNRLVRGLGRLIDAPVKFTVLPMVQKYFSEIAALEPPETRSIYRDLTSASRDPHAVELIMNDKQKASMLRNTISLTVLKAGYKTNVIPAEASAELDCRLLPNVKPEQFIAEIKRVLDDPDIEVSSISWDAAMPSSENSVLFEAIKKVAATETPAVPVVPMVVGWFTDSHWFRELGITSYGFMPVETDGEHLSTVHGKNERIPLAALENGVRRMHKLLLALAAH